MANVINFPSSTAEAVTNSEEQIFADLVTGHKPKIGEDCRFTLPDGPLTGTLTAMIDEAGAPTDEFDVAQLMVIAFPDSDGFTVVPLGPRAHTFSLGLYA